MPEEAKNFIEEMVESDLSSGRIKEVVTRFPPEPNGCLHLGHVKAIWIDFNTAKKYGGKCNLRFDDTNPTKEETQFVEAIQEDIRWLGFEWARLTYASDFFDDIYNCAEKLILKGKAYVCNLSAEELRSTRGTLTEPGTDSPYRNRSVEENLDLFRRMKNGEFPDGSMVLRAKIDMASPNMNMRDPALYRILHASHHRTGDKWCIYPMYDFAHPLEDAFEGITNSLCSLEFEDHRPLYDWVIRECGPFNPEPVQTEFAKLNLTRTMMSKRNLRKLIELGIMSGWDDQRAPTISGIRRRGFPPEALMDFMGMVGVAKNYSVVDFAMLEHCVRERLKPACDRVMCVTDPVKVVIENYPEGKTQMLSVENNGDNPDAGTREIAFSREIYIERDDFMLDPPNKYFRLKLGGEVRLKGAYIIACTGYETDEDGNVTLIKCTYDPDTLSGMPGADRKVKGTLHWVDASSGVPCRINLVDFLMRDNYDDYDDVLDMVNPDSLVVRNGFVEKYAAGSPAGTRYQFLRCGYFNVDTESSAGMPVFNRIVGLKDTWAKLNK